MNTLPLLLKREYWEHRGGMLWSPVWITGVFLLITVLGIVTAEVFSGNVPVHTGFSLDQLRNHISEGDLADAGRGLDVVQVMLASFASIGVFFVTFFYLLGSLYDDRRDRSVLFWKSLPVSDSSTVASKALTAMVIIPAIAIAVATVAYAVFLLVVILWAGVHGLNALPAVFAAHPFGVGARLFATLPVGAMWALPAVGWLMFWSAWARSKPFLWAVMLPLLVWVANWWVGLLGGPHFSGDLRLGSILGRLLLSVMPGSWISVSGLGSTKAWLGAHGGPDIQTLDLASAYGLFATANLWIGVAAGLALLAGAIWLRGRRIEVNV
jgi:ABC-2 type transport system permease protein